jgi:predicted nuclease of restriction endonuclease-like (RecB) superfamily
VPELKRQKASCLYERLALSRDKEGIRKLAKEGQVIVRPEDLLKEPLVLEFLGLEEKSGYSENDLEQAIIDRLEHFLLELGKGFLFEARQKRFTFDEDHYFVDLQPVFYNRLVISAATSSSTSNSTSSTATPGPRPDANVRQAGVNYYDREVKLPEENPTIGLLLCKSAKKTVVELTLPKDANIHAKEYQLYLPTKELLKQKLDEWSAPLPAEPQLAKRTTDGQHRINGAYFALMLRRRTNPKAVFQVPAEVFLDLDAPGAEPKRQAQIFIDVNLHQKKVDRSLVADLFPTTRGDGPLDRKDRAQDIGRRLMLEVGPLVGMIQIPGIKYGVKDVVTLAT